MYSEKMRHSSAELLSTFPAFSFVAPLSREPLLTASRGRSFDFPSGTAGLCFSAFRTGGFGFDASCRRWMKVARLGQLRSVGSRAVGSPLWLGFLEFISARMK
uniref:(northern house mosquito) hypothetical protein n=1 Tax=Culex pipiens TaxID=7175 RepID=A0A8D8BE33_CULPI